MDPRHLHNEELIDLVFTKEDRLTKGEVAEMIRRGTEILPTLSEIVMDRAFWVAELPEWWAPIHAAYVIGAIGGRESLTPLLSAIRWSDAYENEWVSEELPSILGSLGKSSYSATKAASLDRSAGWSARSIAMDGLGSHAVRFPEVEEDVVKIIGGILCEKDEEFGARRSAAYVLIDLRRQDYKRQLIGIAKEEENRTPPDPDWRPAFSPKDVELELSLPRRGLEFYTHDWMKFYEPQEIEKRQMRWAAEDMKKGPHIQSLPEHAGFIVSRKDPCPCGSGKPYKRCCFRKLH
jgi:hypothetical protein